MNANPITKLTFAALLVTALASGATSCSSTEKAPLLPGPQFAENITRSDSAFSIEAPDSVIDMPEPLEIYVMARDASQAYEILVSPPGGSVQRIESDGNISTTAAANGSARFRISYSKGFPSTARHLVITCIPASAEGNKSDLRALGAYVQHKIEVYSSRPQLFADEALTAAMTKSAKLGTAQLRIQGSDVVVRGDDKSIRVTIHCATRQPDKPLTDTVSYFVSPSNLPFTATSTGSQITLEISERDLFTLSEFAVDAYLQDSADDSITTITELAEQGKYVRRTFTVQDHSLPLVRLDVLDSTTAERLFGETFSEEFYACSVHISNPGDSTLIVYGSSINARVQLSAENYEQWPQQMRAVSFGAILEALNDVRRRSTEQSIVDALEFSGKLAAGASVFVTGPDYGSAVALFTGIFTPEVKRLLLEDILAHLSNLQTLGFQEVEQIEPRGQVSKFLFLPRGPILGVVGRDIPAHISGILPDQVGVSGFRVIESRAVTSATQ
jgi:hypothetical protein